MSGEFNTELKVSGNKEELKAVLNVMLGYRNRTRIDDIYFDSIRVNGIWLDHLESPAERLYADIENGVTELVFVASGPFGFITLMEDMNIFFTHVADAAPAAKFNGWIYGFVGTYEGSLFATLVDGILTLMWEGMDAAEMDYGGDCEDLTFVVTGKLNYFENREELTELIEDLGGKVTGSVSKKTDFLINNDLESMSSKNKKAKELGVPIISEEEFLRRFSPGDYEELVGESCDEEYDEDEDVLPVYQAKYDPVARKYLFHNGEYAEKWLKGT